MNTDSGTCVPTVDELQYSIERREDQYTLRLRAKPNQWACDIEGTIEKLGCWGSTELRLTGIGWSCGARDWTTDDARKFFRAGLALMDELDREFARLSGGAK